MSTIRVSVKLFAQYREGRFKVEERTYKEGICAQDIIQELDLERELPLGVLMVNSKHQKPDHVIKEGDIIALFPKVGGG